MAGSLLPARRRACPRRPQKRARLRGSNQSHPDQDRGGEPQPGAPGACQSLTSTSPSGRGTDGCQNQIPAESHRHRQGQSKRRIARHIRVGRDTLARYFAAFEKAGLLEGAADDLPDAARLRVIAAEHLPSKKPKQQRSSVERWRPRIEAMAKAGAGPTAIFDFLRTHEDEYEGSLSAVKRLCANLRRSQGPEGKDVVIPITTLPGEIAQVDFGYAGLRFDPIKRVMRKSWIFVMTLAYSRLTYAEFVFDQKIDTWLAVHVNAFECLGGVPAVIVPDNLKSAVIRAVFGVDKEAVLNRSYRELARAYGFRIDPTPARSPEKKGRVERDVKYIAGNCLATLESVDIKEDQKQLMLWLREVAWKRRHGTTGRPPIELFLEDEKGVLLPLPPKRWDPIVWKPVTVHRDSHVQVDGAFYSAPWRLLRQKIWARCTRTSVELWHEDEHLWTHRCTCRGQHQTVEGHLPEGR
ncbi:MAG: IS21 family transposase, partial [Planctomycetota bacterium]